MRAITPLTVCLLLASSALGGEPKERFALKDGDRVVLLGGGFIELDRQFGFLEARLTRHTPAATVTFRNLGWSGDTVRGVARTSGYQAPEGQARLLKEAADLRPTVLFLGYGMNESFDGPPGLPVFLAEYEKLLVKLAPLKARVVLLSPSYHEDLGRPFPDPTEHNRHLEEYVGAIGDLAAKHGHRFVDLYRPLRAAKEADPKRPLTTNGIHLNDAGYAAVARAVEDQLGYPPRPWRVEVDATGRVLAAVGTTADQVRTDDRFSFRATDDVLAMPGDEGVLRVVGLPRGVSVLKVGGKEACRADAAGWARGVTFPVGPAAADGETYRGLLVRRNGLFYRRWRPFNDHSRHWEFMKGDYALYDAEIAALERQIAERRRPGSNTYELITVGETK